MYPQQKQDILSKLLANKKLLIIVIVGIIALLLTMVTLLSSSGNPVPAKVVAMQSHLEALAELTGKQGRELANSDLRDQNANLSILLAGAFQDLGKMSAEKYGKIDPDKKSAAGHASRLAKLEVDFESAINTNTLDTVYKKRLAEEVATIEQQLISYARSSRGTTASTLLSVADRLSQGRDSLEKVKL